MAKGHKIRRYNRLYRTSNKGRVVKVVVSLLLVGFLAAAGWFLYEPVYDFILSYGASGEIPQSSEVEQPSSSQPEPSSSQPEQGEPTPPEQTETGLKMAYVPHSVVANAATLDSYINALPKGAINTVVIDLKNDAGQVLYATALPEPTRYKAVASNAYSLADVVGRFKAAGINVVGRFWAFKDHIAPLSMYDAAVKYLGTEYNWLDNSVEQGGKPWLNPYHPEAQQYLLSLVNEALDAGVSGIVMVGVQFPEGFSLEKANYGATGGVSRSDALASFMSKVRQQVEAKDGIGCWSYFSASQLLNMPTGELALYGSNPQALFKAADNMVEVMPALFGAELTLPSGNIQAPITKPYETVKAVLTAAGANESMLPVVQAFTQQGVAAAYNLNYTKAQVEAQLKAATELGLEQGYLLYNPAGNYSLMR